MEYSRSCEAIRSSSTQEIPRILWNPKVHYRIHNSLQRVPILRQINLVHTPPPPLHSNVEIPASLIQSYTTYQLFTVSCQS